MVGPDLVRALEQEARLAGLDHAQVVVAVPAGDGLIADGLQRLHRGQLGLRAAHPKAGDLPAGGHLQGVAEEGGPAQLFHQGLGKLLEGVAEDDDLGEGAKLVQERLGPGQGVDFGDGGLNLFQAQAVLLQDGQPVLHQLVVVRLVPGGALQLRDAAGVGKGDPDLRHQHAFHIQTYEIHGGCSSPTSFSGWPGNAPSGSAPRTDPSWRWRSSNAQSPRR